MEGGARARGDPRQGGSAPEHRRDHQLPRVHARGRAAALPAIATPRRKPDRAEYTTHAIFFPAGITVIEYLTNLDRIGAARCRFVALALEGADGSPVRAIAITE